MPSMPTSIVTVVWSKYASCGVLASPPRSVCWCWRLLNREGQLIFWEQLASYASLFGSLATSTASWWSTSGPERHTRVAVVCVKHRNVHPQNCPLPHVAVSVIMTTNIRVSANAANASHHKFQADGLCVCVCVFGGGGGETRTFPPISHLFAPQSCMLSQRQSRPDFPTLWRALLMGHECERERAVMSGFVKLRVGFQEMLLAQSSPLMLQLVMGRRIGFITYHIFSHKKKKNQKQPIIFACNPSALLRYVLL